MQLNLAFLESVSPSARLWQHLDQEDRAAALQLLARLIAQAAQANTKESGNDRQHQG